MKIKEIIVTPIAIGDPPLLNASGLHAPYALRIIIELVGENGMVGISEVPGDIDALNIFNKIKEFKDQIDIYNLEPFRELIRENFATKNEDRGLNSWDSRSVTHIESAIEVASLDLIGKKENKRVCDLLGGAKREEVPFAGYLFFKYKGAGGEFGFNLDPNATGWAKERQNEALTPEEIVRQAKSMLENFGFKSLKLKAGILDPRIETDSILALHKEFGSSIPIRIDPNAVWSYETALKYGKEMKGVIEYYEDPVRGQEDMAKLKKELGIPLATNMATTSFEDLDRSIELDSENIILLDHHFWGGLTPALKMATMAKSINRDVSMHSNSHVGISLAAMVHLGATIPDFTYSLDTHYPWQEDEIIKGGKIEIKNGSIKVPSGPGLGVEIDQEKLKKAHEKYLTCGLVKRNDEIEMQKVNPDWKFKKIRY